MSGRKAPGKLRANSLTPRALELVQGRRETPGRATTFSIPCGSDDQQDTAKVSFQNPMQLPIVKTSKFGSGDS
jgi:hypothetical protein